jgi:hypothetical protein
VQVGNPYHVAILLAVLAFWIGGAALVGRLAERKGRSFAVYFIISLIIGWWFPLLAALIVRRPRKPAA